LSIEKAYNSWAKQYDSNLNKTRDLDIKSTIETLSKYAFDVVLELGCGTGKNTTWLLTQAKRIIGLDFSEEMLAIAKHKISDSRAEFIKMDLTKEWNIESHCADLVTSSLTLEHIQDLDHIFTQTNRALKENGHFFISEYHPFKQYLGKGARFEAENGLVELAVYTHHITDFTNSALQNGFELIEIKEWFDNTDKKEIPRLVSFVFKKNQSIHCP